jgi:hypothetical protein
LCDQDSFFFGSVFNLKKNEYQWNCHTKRNNGCSNNEINSLNFEECTPFDLVCDNTPQKNRYEWNCMILQNSIDVKYETRELEILSIYE